MIVNELRALQKYIIDETGTQCGIGNEDLAPEQYPYISILFEKSIPVFFKNLKLSVFNMELTLKITVARGNEVAAFERLIRLLDCLAQFNQFKGHRVLEGASVDPTETDNTFELDVPFILHFCAQDS